MQISAEEYSELDALLSSIKDNDILKAFHTKMRECTRTKADDRLHDFVRKNLCNDEIEIDDVATVSQSDEGAWVSGWLWVPIAELYDMGAQKPTAEQAAKMLVSNDIEVHRLSNTEVSVRLFNSENAFCSLSKAELSNALAAIDANPDDYLTSPQIKITDQEKSGDS